MSNRSEKVISSSDDDANSSEETPEIKLARFLASFEQSNSTYVDYQALRQRLLGVIGETVQSIRRHQDAGIDSRNGLAAANDVLASMKQTMEQLTKSMQAEHEVVTMLLGKPQAQEDSAINRMERPANRQLTDMRPGQSSLSDRLLAPQIAEALRRVIEKEVDRRLRQIRLSSSDR